MLPFSTPALESAVSPRTPLMERGAEKPGSVCAARLLLPRCRCFRALSVGGARAQGACASPWMPAGLPLRLEYAAPSHTPSSQEPRLRVLDWEGEVGQALFRAGQTKDLEG